MEKFLNRVFLVFLSIFLILPISCSKIYSKEIRNTYKTLSEQEKDCLRAFFSCLFESPFGYVLCGDKPIYHRLIKKVEGYNHSPTIEENEDELLLKAEEILKKFKLRNRNYIFLIRNSDIPKFKDTHLELMLINKRALIKVIQNDLSLFQKKFGKDLRAEDLVQKILKDGFYKTFVGNLALQGIVFGYGTESSVAYEQGSRFSDIFYKYCNENSIAYKGLSDEEITQMMLKYIDQHYETWGQVRDIIQNTIGYEDNDVMIPFSYTKNSHEAEQIIKAYKKYHKKALQFLKSKNFVENALYKLDS